MPLWGKTDNANSAPKYLAADIANTAFFVDTTEAAVAANRAKGLKTPGWNTFTTYTDADGKTRTKVESLIPMRVAAGAAGDLGVANNTTIEDSTVADS